MLRTRDVRNIFFNFGSIFGSALEKNSDSVRNKFGSVRFAKTRFGSDSYYAALLARRGPHNASHSVCLSVRLSVRPVLCLQLHRLTSEHPK